MAAEIRVGHVLDKLREMPSESYALVEEGKRGRVQKGRRHVGSVPRPIELTERMEVLYQKAKFLNLVGIRSPL